jgi:GNAT superfamily N-acetyltransferase
LAADLQLLDPWPGKTIGSGARGNAHLAAQAALSKTSAQATRPVSHLRRCAASAGKPTFAPWRNKDGARPQRYGIELSMTIRDALESEIPALAALWRDAWMDGHAAHVPAELTALRTLDSFESRLREAYPEIRVAGPVGAVRGFHVLKGAELYQLFVAADARGSGVAAELIDDAEARLAERGVPTAHLTCAIGNRRAARFYEKRGWHLARTVMEAVPTTAGPYTLEVWRYEKALTT